MARRVEGDDGATLVLVLAFVTVLGLLGTSLLNQSTAGLGRSVVAREYQDKVYAADAAVDAAIQQLRNDDALCPVTGSTGTLAALTVNGKSVATTCSTVSGSSLGARGYAVVTTEGGVDSFETQSGGGGVKKVGGNVFATRLSDAIDIAVEKGSVREKEGPSSCTVPGGPRPGSLFFQPSVNASGTVLNTPGATPVPPYSYRCTNQSWTAFDPAKTLGSSLPRVHTLPTRDRAIGSGANECHVFRPGTYAAGITFGPQNYLASGMYYFPAGDVRVQAQDVIGGARATGDAVVNTGVGCPGVTDADVPASDPLVPNGDDPSGTGVTLVLGGTARLIVNNPGGRLEVYTRTGAGAAEAGTTGVGIITVPATGAPAVWTPNLRAVTDPVVQVGTGDTPALAVHGLIYIPGRMLDMNATNTSVAQLSGGVVAGRILYQASASAATAGISIGSGPGRRRVEIVSTASEAGERDIVTRAVVDIENDDSRSVTISSWYTPVG